MAATIARIFCERIHASNGLSACWLYAGWKFAKIGSETAFLSPFLTNFCVFWLSFKSYKLSKFFYFFISHRFCFILLPDDVNPNRIFFVHSFYCWCLFYIKFNRLGRHFWMRQTRKCLSACNSDNWQATDKISITDRFDLSHLFYLSIWSCSDKLLERWRKNTSGTWFKQKLQNKFKNFLHRIFSIDCWWKEKLCAAQPKNISF